MKYSILLKKRINKQLTRLWLSLCIALLLLACESNSDISTFEPPGEEVFDRGLTELGERLFFDKRLSVDGSIACADCHIPALVFTDAKRMSEGIHGRKGKRNSPTLFNAANQDKFMWDGGVKTLELQALVPLQDTNEMGHMVSDLIPELEQDAYYDSMARTLYNRSFDPFVLTRALGHYQRSLYREDSRYDQWKRGEISDKRLEKGNDLFVNQLNCASCHTPPTFTNNSIANTGRYRHYEDPGRYRITGDVSDSGAFKVPTLRNVEMTAPYMHDGAMKTLDTVIDHYARGGVDHPNKDKRITPFELSEQERADLIYFLRALSDERYKNHWQKVFRTVQ
ncbi:MAG: cytochrome-c peroxidase [Bacteroidota bacterium]